MKIRFRRVTLLCVWLAVSLFVLEWSSSSTAQDGPDDDGPADELPVGHRRGEDRHDEARGPGLIAYSGGDFDGRPLRVRSTLLDMPEERTDDGETYDWNDRISSIVVVRGTWRLYQNGRCNTELDDTPLGELDVATKQAVGGWSCLVSAGTNGPRRIAFRDGLFADNDISSIELVSERALRAVSETRRRTRAPEIEVFWDTEFGGRSLIITGSVAELPTFTTETGETLSWDDNISSIAVRGGTWRLCEAARYNRGGGGWSAVVSAGRNGALRQRASECGGWTNDSISSIRLVSDTVMEERGILNREARAR